MLRRERLGFIFQAFNLIPTLSAIENITLPSDLAGRSVDAAWLDHVIATVGLADRTDHRPNELSGGQQQRVAAARALIGRPPLIIADEPTSALDSNTRSAFIQLLFSEVESAGSSLLFVSHDDSLASLFDRRIELAEINKSDVMLSLQSEFTC